MIIFMKCYKGFNRTLSINLLWFKDRFWALVNHLFQKSPGSGTPPQFPSTPIKSSSKANSTTSLGPSASEQPHQSETSNEITASKTPSDIETAPSDIAMTSDKREATPDLISVSPVKERSPENFENENGEEKKDEEKESENEKEEITVQV